MSKLIDNQTFMKYTMDSRNTENCFLNPPKQMGGKGNFRKMDKNVYLGGGQFKTRSNWENQFITMPQREFGYGISSPKVGQYGMGTSYIGNVPFNTHSISGMKQDYGMLQNKGGANLALSNSQGRFGYGMNGMPLQPPKSRYNSSRLASERVFFD